MQQVTHFLLVPDSGAARRLRRELVTSTARTGCVVGVWSELIEYAKRAYLSPNKQSDWESRFHSYLGDFAEAFWSESYQVAPNETANAIQLAHVQLLFGREPGEPLNVSGADFPKRMLTQLEDLVQLIDAMEGALPDDLAAIQQLLAADVNVAIQRVQVYYLEELFPLNRWQNLLVEKLNRDAEKACDQKLEIDVKVLLNGSTQGQPRTCLEHIQSNLYALMGNKKTPDETVQWVGVRDYLEEAEVAAGMVQTMLAQDKTLNPADIGVLLPDRFEYTLAIENVFNLAGILVSGLPAQYWKRDLGREALFHFLYCRSEPAPAMAIAACLSSPLMPWSREEGAKLAQEVMKGRYALKPFRGAGQNARNMLELIRGNDQTPESLAEALRLFVSLLDSDDDCNGHAHRARSASEELYRLLENTQEIDWSALRSSCSPKPITDGGAANFNLEGVTIWREAHEPWRPVSHLIVAGFSQGHYPSSSSPLPVFSTKDLVLLRDQLGLDLSTPDDGAQLKRERFKRQLGAVSKFITFLVPQMDQTGRAQSASDSLVFMRKLLDMPDEKPIILMLDSLNDSEKIRFLPLVDGQAPILPRELAKDDIKFDTNLLALQTDEDGMEKPESPSSMETLMISRLAWLLKHLGAEPMGWVPEKLDPMLLGTLAHQVFENLFQKGQPVPDKREIEDRIETLLDDAIDQHAPFLKSSQWKVERQNLQTSTLKAAIAWSDLLQKLDAEVLGSEVWLQGKLKSVAIHGQADAVLGLPDRRLLVVDYKRSKSDKRRPRMEKGYDSQASLYRTMLQTGAPKDSDFENMTEQFRNASQTGVVYYMLNDQFALSDTVLSESAEIPAWDALENDVSAQAIRLIERRLEEVKAGKLSLNREGDHTFFEKHAGIKDPYALKASPLVSLFTIPGEAVEAEE